MNDTCQENADLLCELLIFHDEPQVFGDEIQNSVMGKIIKTCQGWTITVKNGACGNRISDYR